MNINLTPEQERIVSEEVKSGHFPSAEEVIAKALIALREKDGTSFAASRAVDDGDRAVREMMNFVEKNRIPLPDVSVKQLIREGHRL
jgi:Arc/MetJ-type ribon-helix-helix transcriptional regulator